MPSPDKHDWETIRRHYVEGIDDDTGNLYWPTLADLSRRHGPRRETISRRSTNEGWNEDRDNYRRLRDITRQAARAEALAAHGVALDTDAVEAARKAIRLVNARLDEIEAHGVTVLTRTAHGDVDEHRAADAQELTALATAAARSYDLGRAAIGDIPEVNLNVGGEVAVDVELRQHRAELILGVLVETGALPGAPLELLTGEA